MMSACLCAAVYGALTLMCVCLRRGHPRGMLAAYVLLFVPVINLFLVLLWRSGSAVAAARANDVRCEIWNALGKL